ncbi:Transposon Ty3-I Gag-Pol poly [Paramuricea clavata]|uniref:Transposon Ty3-I Gag-Pol poly n=1 Tax=Paramuricea clavata TaxID=317549 RepID=A0A6S7HPN1_PARCT|nr:Transposon Ty3-I Gag-Pol poly [Paramuricea clavata]
MNLQRFLGMVNYLSKFVPNLSQTTTPLREMLKKDVHFDLQQPQLDAIQELKRLITSPPCLKFYDPNLPTRFKPDASADGLGALLEQNHGSDDSPQWFPIAYASRALLPYERNYAQIEKEALSIVFGTERFHEYLYGHHFTAFNDHQPLKSIFSKSITQCPPRIQRFFMKLQNDAHLTEFQKETASDTTLQQLKEYTLKGWPQQRDIPQTVKPYYNIRDEIVYNNGLLLKGQRIIIPSSLRSTIKAIIHQGHTGIESCKNRARINKQQKETLIQPTVPNAPWTKVASDLFSLYGHDYVIVTDYFSKYIEIERLTDKSSATVVNKIKKIYTRHGIPKELCSDNGPEYTAACFKQFVKEWDFKHTTSSPHFSQSNGFVERAIQTVKKNTRAKTKERCDQHAKDLPDIQPGTVVLIRAKEDEKWSQLGKVVEKCAEPRSYRVLNDKGNIVRRNRRHLIPCKNRFQIRNDLDYDDLEVTTRPSSPEPPNEIVTRSGRVVRKPTNKRSFKLY